jgi:hypothetical protein
MTALEVGFVQNPGIAWITLEDGASNVDESLLSEIGSCAMSLPIRIVTLHYCCSTKRQGEATPDMLTQSLAASNNIRSQIHNNGKIFDNRNKRHRTIMNQHSNCMCIFTNSFFRDI